jgi:hypothetical protein
MTEADAKDEAMRIAHAVLERYGIDLPVPVIVMIKEAIQGVQHDGVRPTSEPAQSRRHGVH